MPTTEEKEQTTWKQIGVRVHPDIWAQLRSAAPLKKQTAEVFLHQLLCRELDRADLMTETPTSDRD